jgi:hypothetical protein
VGVPTRSRGLHCYQGGFDDVDVYGGGPDALKQRIARRKEFEERKQEEKRETYEKKLQVCCLHSLLSSSPFTGLPGEGGCEGGCLQDCVRPEVVSERGHRDLRHAQTMKHRSKPSYSVCRKVIEIIESYCQTTGRQEGFFSILDDASDY